MGKENDPCAAAMKEQWIVTKVGVESKDAYYAEIAKEVAEYRRSRSTTQVGIILYFQKKPNNVTTLACSWRHALL